MNKVFLPPLRLILTTLCNGNCFFCHSEGVPTKQFTEMSLDTISTCIDAVNKLGINRISLTGGEPTLHGKIVEIIRHIKKKVPNVNLSITSNGENLNCVLETAGSYLDRISVSITSLNENIYNKYSAVNPNLYLKTLSDYNASKKNVTINIVVTDDNIDEFPALTEHFINLGFSVDLMSALPKTKNNEYKRVEDSLNDYANKRDFRNILISSTPTLIERFNEHQALRIKASSYSHIIWRKSCNDCPHYESCAEQVCAVRVYPNNYVSPCLNNHHIFNSSDVFNNIISAYKVIGNAQLARFNI
ncbi:MAG: radical SAM protein [Defluviitaleaceae bacterium]|nr:radical SAM protein [Defluviitaleaceae bacterium]